MFVSDRCGSLSVRRLKALAKITRHSGGASAERQDEITPHKRARVQRSTLTVSRRHVEVLGRRKRHLNGYRVR